MWSWVELESTERGSVMARGGAINVGQIIADLSIDGRNIDRGLANGRRAMDAFRAEIERLGGELNRGEIAIGAYASRLSVLQNQYNRIQAAMRQGYNFANVGNGLGVLNQQMGRLTNTNWGRFAFGLQQTGYLIDDLQYSISACVNNIGPLVMGFTGNAGIAGAAQISAVALNYLVQHWDQLLYRLSGDTSQFTAAGDRIDGLRKMVKALKDELASTPGLSVPRDIERAENEIERNKDDEDLGKKTHTDMLTKGEKKERDRFLDSIKDINKNRGDGTQTPFLHESMADHELMLAQGRDKRKRDEYIRNHATEADKQFYEALKDPKTLAQKGYLWAGIRKGVSGDKAVQDRIDGIMARTRKKRAEEIEREMGGLSKAPAWQREDFIARARRGRQGITQDQADVIRGKQYTREEVEEREKKLKETRKNVDKTIRGFFNKFGEKAVKINDKNIEAEQAAIDVQDAENLKAYKKQQADNKKRGDAARKQARETLPDFDKKAREAGLMQDQKTAITRLANQLVSGGMKRDAATFAASDAVKTQRRNQAQAAHDFAKEHIAGLENLSEYAALNGKDGGNLAQGIRNHMKKLGLSDEAANLVVDQTLKGGRKKFNDDVANRALSGAYARHSEVMRAADIGNRIQGAVTNENKTTAILEQIKDQQAEYYAKSLEQNIVKVQIR